MGKKVGQHKLSPCSAMRCFPGYKSRGEEQTSGQAPHRMWRHCLPEESEEKSKQRFLVSCPEKQDSPCVPLASSSIRVWGKDWWKSKGCPHVRDRYQLKQGGRVLSGKGENWWFVFHGVCILRELGGQSCKRSWGQEKWSIKLVEERDNQKDFSSGQRPGYRIVKLHGFMWPWRFYLQ